MSPIHPRLDIVEMLPELILGILVTAILWTAGLVNNPGKNGWRISLAFMLACIGMTIPLLGSGSFTNANYTDRYGFLLSAVIWCWTGVVIVPYCRRFRRAAAGLTLLLAAGYLSINYFYLETFSDTELLFGRAAVHEKCPPKAIEGLALTGMNRNNPEIIHSAGNLFLSRATQNPKNFQTYTDTGQLCVLIAEAMREAENDDLVDYLTDIDQKQIYSPQDLLPSAYKLALHRLLNTGRPREAIKLLDKQVQRRDGSLFELKFAAGFASFLAGDFAGAVRKWESALQIKPDDEMLRVNLDAARRKLGN